MEVHKWLSEITHQMWYDHRFSQRNKTIKKALGWRLEATQSVNGASLFLSSVCLVPASTPAPVIVIVPLTTKYKPLQSPWHCNFGFNLTTGVTHYTQIIIYFNQILCSKFWVLITYTMKQICNFLLLHSILPLI